MKRKVHFYHRTGIEGQTQGQVIEKYIFQFCDFHQIKLRTCVIPHFHGFSTGRSFYVIVFVIQGDVRDQKVILKVKCLNIYLYKCQQTSCVIPFFDLILIGESIYGTGYYFGD